MLIDVFKDRIVKWVVLVLFAQPFPKYSFELWKNIPGKDDSFSSVSCDTFSGF